MQKLSNYYARMNKAREIKLLRPAKKIAFQRLIIYFKVKRVALSDGTRASPPRHKPLAFSIFLREAEK